MALESIEGVIKGLENQESWQAQRQFRLVLIHWPKAVGFSVARKTRPTGLQRQVLYVATETASWAQTLSYERFNILKKLNRHQPQPLQDIRFSTAQWAKGKAIAPTSLANNPSLHSSMPNSSMPNNSISNSSISNDAETSNAHPATQPLASVISWQHPSNLGDVPHLPKQRAQTPQKAFKQWAAALQSMHRTQAVCPTCRCHCPQGELDRWTCCGHCAIKRWR